MGERSYSYVKRKQPKPRSGYSNFYINKRGRTGLKIGSIDYGLMEINAESIAFRDKALINQGLKPAEY